jgi:hypothetical protein
MSPEKKKQLDEYVRAIADILYEEAEEEQVETLFAIEETIRDQTLEYITPQLGVFLSKSEQEQKQEEKDPSKAS